MKFKLALTCFILFAIVIEAYSEVNIYLFSKSNYAEVIRVRDVGKIEYKNESIDPGDLVISNSLFSDGLIDSKELRSFLMKYFEYPLKVG